MTAGQQTNTFDRVARVGFLVLVALIPVVRPLSFYVGGLRVSLSDVIFPLVFVFWLVARIVNKRGFRIEPFHWFVGLYAATLILSAIFSVEPERSFLKLIGEFYLFGLGVVAYDLVRYRDFAKQAVFAWLAGTAVTIIASLVGFGLFYLGYKTQADNYFLSHAGSLPAGNYPRIHALFANANMMCNFLNVSLMLSFLAGYLGWIRSWAAWLFAGGIWFAAIFTFSSGLGGMLLSSGIWLGTIYSVKNEKIRSRLIISTGILAAILIFAAACISPDTANTDQQIPLAGMNTVIEPSVRVLVWQDTLRTIAAHPLIGKGIGTDPAKVFYSTISGQNQILSDAHNMYLSVLAQAGIVGFVALASLIFFLIRRFTFDLNSERRTILTALSCAIIGAFLYQGLTGSFEDARHLWILIGIFASVSAYGEDSDSTTSVEGVEV